MLLQDLKSKLSNLGKARARLPKVDEAIKKAEVRVTFDGALPTIDRVHQGQFQDCNEKISRMEEEHRRLGTLEHISHRRNEIREKIRILNQEIQELTVRNLLFRLPPSYICPFHVLRVNRKISTAA